MGKKDKDGGLSEEDLALWRRVTQDAAPLSERRKPAPETPPAVPRRAPSQRPPAAARDTRPREPDLTHGSSAGLDKRKAERLKRGRLPIEARLDLHGRTLDAAKGSVERFLAEHDRIFVVEQNRDAQLRGLIETETGVEKDKLSSILHYNGIPMDSGVVERAIEETLAKEAAA